MTPLDPSDEYRINLSVFEGPIDLLLYLIRKNELDIHEVSLALIAKEYLDYVDLMRMVDLECAGDFIVMASTLMKIKARSLFNAGDPDEDVPDDDPRKQLVRYLMEFEKLGSLADHLAEKEEARQGIFPRGGEENRIIGQMEETPEPADYQLFDLLSALKDVVKSAPKLPTHQVELINVTPEMKRKEILSVLESKEEIDFIELVSGQPRIVIVVTFIAMLDLIKGRKIGVRQANQFGRIVMYRRKENDQGNN